MPKPRKEAPPPYDGPGPRAIALAALTLAHQQAAEVWLELDSSLAAAAQGLADLANVPAAQFVAENDRIRALLGRGAARGQALDQALGDTLKAIAGAITTLV